MVRLHRPGGFKAGIAIGAALALVGVLFGVAVASIPSSSGVIERLLRDEDRRAPGD